MPNAYAVLQLDPGAELVVIQAAYRALARRYHPDGDAPNPARMSDVNRAYQILRDPERRRRHDADLAAAKAPTPITAADRGVHPSPPSPRVAPWRSSRPDEAEHATLDFGRYMGWRIADLARHDPDYLRWLSRHSSGIRFRAVIARVLPRERGDLGRSASSVA